ncbi:hypothetical protein H010_00570 [Hydrogenophaga taeniospiralis CCUG 15921]|uniref:Uncharacterized protein n=1 Tax=Hydrogenophaga taeniospiralis CCUG 15921 TaxID=1281780 RepID=A0A9X4NNS3_9BURK|nr:hypothetical protein [Hydrogenophaga taeniospiralis]MDG5973721.1 hypothetical protein [Hydrogenophaga taeniospiralis CCUG 15921]
MAGATKPEGTAWRRRRQGTGPSAAAIEEVRANLKEAIAAKRAAEAADLSKLAMPVYPGDSATNAEKVAWAKSVETINKARPRTEARKEFDLEVAEVRHNYEKSGLNWDGTASMGTLMTTNLWLVRQLGAATDRIKKLEEQAVKLQEVTEHAAKHQVRFAGSFDLTNHYSEGAITRYKGMLFIAVKDIAAGKTYPPREGSGWAPFA